VKESYIDPLIEKMYYLFLEATKDTNFIYEEGQDKLIKRIRHIIKDLRLKNGMPFINGQQNQLREYLHILQKWNLVEIEEFKAKVAKGRVVTKYRHKARIESNAQPLKETLQLASIWHNLLKRNEIYLAITNLLTINELRVVTQSLINRIFRGHPTELLSIFSDEQLIEEQTNRKHFDKLNIRRYPNRTPNKKEITVYDIKDKRRLDLSKENFTYNIEIISECLQEGTLALK
jgi:hypothetical protein